MFLNDAIDECGEITEQESKWLMLKRHMVWNGVRADVASTRHDAILSRSKSAGDAVTGHRPKCVLRSSLHPNANEYPKNKQAIFINSMHLRLPTLRARRASEWSTLYCALPADFDENGIAGRHPIDAQSSPGSVILHPTPSAHHGNRRESFLYRTDVDFDQSSPLASRASSIYSDQHGGEDLIVTPYAQVLASLRRIRNDFISLTSIGTSVPINSSRRSPITAAPRVGSPTVSASGQQSPGYPTYGTEEFKKQSLDTLDELDWCLDQLEKVQTHRSVSEMASNKFKRMLNRELNQLSETSKSGNQVSEFISATYLD